MILLGHENPRNCVDLGMSEWDQKLGKKECVFSFYDEIRWKWDEVKMRWGEDEMMSIYPGVSRICTPRRSVHLRYPWISIHLPSLIGNVLEGRHWASYELHREAEIEWTHRCTWRPRSSELRDALGGQVRVNTDMHLETKIEWTQRSTGRLGVSEFRDALAGYDRARWEEYLEAVHLQGGAMAAETLFIG